MAATVKPLRGRAAAEAAAAAKAREIAEAALAQRDAREGAHAASKNEIATEPELNKSDPAASLLHLEDAAQLRGGPVPMVPWYSGRSGDAPVLAKVDHEKVRKMREEFEGASAEYKVLSQAALSGLNSGEGKSLQERFKELEQAWGAFQWNQKSRSPDAPSTREQVQAASAALAQAHGRLQSAESGLDLEQEVENVLADLWDTIEKPPKQKPDQADEDVAAVNEELDRLEAFIEARIQEEEKAEQEGRKAKSQANMEVCEAQSEALQDMSAKFQSALPSGMDEGTGGTPMTSNAVPEETPMLPAAVHFGSEVRTLAREVQSVSTRVNQEHFRREPPRGYVSSNWIGDLAGGSGPALHDRDAAWGNVFMPARSPMPRQRPMPSLHQNAGR